MIIHTIALVMLCLSSSLLVSTEIDFRDKYAQDIDNLKEILIERGVSIEWIYENLLDSSFQIYENIETYFTNLPEHRVDRGEMSVLDYKQRFDVDRRAERGLSFIEEHRGILDRLQQKNGIDYELVVAILGIETNFASQRHRGSFIVFDSLVSQYVLIPRRQRFAVNQLVALYEFSKLTNRERSYFTGSFAGATGWGQFIPTSLIAYFISSDGIAENTDIFSIEDTLFSIDNYLFLHNLNNQTMKSEKHLREAVFAYNRSNAYVEAVLYIYHELKKLRIN